MALLGKGFNPLRWDCNKGGPGQNCFNLKRRPKIEAFHDCFPGNINFGDVDGIVEINGKALMLEWKSSGGLQTGQKIMYERISKTGMITVLCINGNPETMECESYFLYFKGKKSKPIKCGLSEIKEKIKRWVSFAKRKTP